jgi:CheY-like chemotaxis protein
LDQARPFDLVLLDLGLPVLGGADAARQIRALEGARRASPATVLAISAHAGAEQHRQATAAGMNGVLGKPLEPGALTAAVSRRAAAV